MSWIDCLVDNEYEIFTESPYSIRKKSTGKIVNEWREGYNYIEIHNVEDGKHRVIAIQFIPNDDPLVKSVEERINYDKTGHYIENFHWVTPSPNDITRPNLNYIEREFIKHGDEEENLVQVWNTEIIKLKDKFMIIYRIIGFDFSHLDKSST